MSAVIALVTPEVTKVSGNVICKFSEKIFLLHSKLEYFGCNKAQ